MSRFLVTHGDYRSIMASSPSASANTNCPVEDVSWCDATNYCFQLTQQERQSGRLPLGWAYRLPTEAEWEYACRAGTTTRFSFGDDPDNAAINFYAWYVENSGGKPPLYDEGASHPVGTKLPNPWGLYDMHGNVCEWCLDAYGPYPGGAVTNWVVRATASLPVPVFRGGSWAYEPWGCRSAFRGYNWATYSSLGLGFRVVLAPEQP